MKKIVSVSFCVLLSVLCFSQAGKKLPAASSSNAHLKVFDLALSTGDINTAITALNYYITDQGAGNKYVDTLAMLYMQQGAFAQCLFWADKRESNNCFPSEDLIISFGPINFGIANDAKIPDITKTIISSTIV